VAYLGKMVHFGKTRRIGLSVSSSHGDESLTAKAAAAASHLLQRTIGETQMSSSIFLCHSHLDAEFVHQLCLDLEQEEIQVWLDRAQLQPADSLIERVEEAIEEMDYLGVVLSPRSVKSNWVRQEVNMALTIGIHARTAKVIPILIEDCRIPGFLLDRVYVDFRDRSEHSYSQSLEYLCNLLHGRVPGIPKRKYCVLFHVRYRGQAEYVPRSITVVGRTEREARGIAEEQLAGLPNAASLSYVKTAGFSVEKRTVHPDLGIVTVSSNADLGILNGNIQYPGRPHWGFSVWIEPLRQKDTSYGDVRKVIYHLHDSYVDRLPQKTNWKDNFNLDRLGWVDFRMAIDLLDDKGQTIATIYHDLTF